ncbi:MBL fold metallo-hydrolase [Campylobacter hyointestinalis]|uniref:MBL fold metallo-hydrolase n=1 Tax=Campylobacter hyointestinalis TaxID=198 RepID=UPI000DCEDA65|nr:MBL fold metallo-hydrolase [Campylobacter hyointestinalis]RAZ25378.1 MBL fold metallo-hydrolase [Campylobacter hyointestinalis subsp. lawsonii]RAZ38525.1 MBL fold metallo-hydrolase [Campylobacter hyointestinalis subsp. lawsonii]
MQILSKAFGDLATNCYIVENNGKEVIIDPGDGAYEYVVKICKNPVAILNTHCHFDHIYDDLVLKNKFNIPIYVPKDDAFLCEADPFGVVRDKFTPDFLVDHDETINLADLEFKFLHFPGHTPGCSMIEVNDVVFSGDFIFKGSIGRYDFPFSNPKDMKNSLIKALKLKNYTIYPGHGFATSLDEERQNLSKFLNHF